MRNMRYEAYGNELKKKKHDLFNSKPSFVILFHSFVDTVDVRK